MLFNFQEVSANIHNQKLFLKIMNNQSQRPDACNIPETKLYQIKK
jgi:hypothetical protein